MIKIADSKGRITLGPKFANQPVVIEDVDDTAVQVSLADVVPRRERWLHQDPEALASIRRGLEQADRGEFVEPPEDF